MISRLLNCLNELGEKGINFFLKPYNLLPGSLKFLILIIIIFLSIVGLFRVTKHALKTIVSISCIFITLLILWVIFK